MLTKHMVIWQQQPWQQRLHLTDLMRVLPPLAATYLCACPYPPYLPHTTERSQEAVRMDHLEVVKLMEQSGGKVWEEGQVRALETKGRRGGEGGPSAGVSGAYVTPVAGMFGVCAGVGRSTSCTAVHQISSPLAWSTLCF